MDAKKRIALTLGLVAAGCLVMAWVEGALRPIYPVKSALKAAVFLGCAGLYTLLSRDRGAFRAFQRPSRIKPALLLAAGGMLLVLWAAALSALGASTVTPAGASPPLRAACSVAIKSPLRMVETPRRPSCLASSLSSGSFISSRFEVVAN